MSVEELDKYPIVDQSENVIPTGKLTDMISASIGQLTGTTGGNVPWQMKELQRKYGFGKPNPDIELVNPKQAELDEVLAEERAANDAKIQAIKAA